MGSSSSAYSWRGTTATAGAGSAEADTRSSRFRPRALSGCQDQPHQGRSVAFASAFLYAFWGLGLAFWGLGLAVYRGRLSNWLIILISALGGTATYAIVGTLTGELTFDTGDAMPGLLGGPLNVGATYLLLMAYQRGKVAIASGVVATYVIVRLGYSVYSGQPFTGLAIVGVRPAHTEDLRYNRHALALPQHSPSLLPLLRRPHRWPPSDTPPSTGSSQAGLDPLPDQVSLKLSQRPNGVENESAGGGRGVDALCHTPQRDTALLQVTHHLQQMTQRASKAVETPSHQGVTTPNHP